MIEKKGEKRSEKAEEATAAEELPADEVDDNETVAAMMTAAIAESYDYADDEEDDEKDDEAA